MKAADLILGDPATKKAIQIQWPLIWKFILTILPALLPILIALLSAKGVKITSSSQEPLVTEADYPPSVKEALAVAS